MIANFALCVLQREPAQMFRFVLPTNPGVVYAAISSLSLSLLATGIDSVFDIGSNVLLYYLHKKAARLDINKWPVGGSRLETIGNIVYGQNRILPPIMLALTSPYPRCSVRQMLSPRPGIQPTF